MLSRSPCSLVPAGQREHARLPIEQLTVLGISPPLEGNGFELPVPRAMQERLKGIIAGFGCNPPSPIICASCRRTSPKAGQSEVSEPEALTRAEPEVRIHSPPAKSPLRTVAGVLQDPIPALGDTRLDNPPEVRPQPASSCAPPSPPVERRQRTRFGRASVTRWQMVAVSRQALPRVEPLLRDLTLLLLLLA
jgi:hypothetical protein